MQEKEPCPLTQSEWVQFLISQQNQHLMGYYSEVQYLFTKIIILLTLATIGFAFFSILVSLNIFPEEVKALPSIILSIIVGIAGFTFVAFSVHAKKIKETNLKPLINREETIINDILEGKLTNSNEIKERYNQLR